MSSVGEKLKCCALMYILICLDMQGYKYSFSATTCDRACEVKGAAVHLERSLFDLGLFNDLPVPTSLF